MTAIEHPADGTFSPPISSEPVPPQATAAAAGFLHDDECNDGDTKTCGRWKAGSNPQSRFHSLHVGHVEFYRDRATAVLEAAAPHLAAGAPGSLFVMVSRDDLRAVLAEGIVPEDVHGRLTAALSGDHAREVAERAEEIHAEHHPGTFVPTLDSCPEHTRAEYEQMVTDLLGRQP